MYFDSGKDGYRVQRRGEDGREGTILLTAETILPKLDEQTEIDQTTIAAETLVSALYFPLDENGEFAKHAGKAPEVTRPIHNNSYACINVHCAESALDLFSPNKSQALVEQQRRPPS